jgi:hypothetical protein
MTENPTELARQLVSVVCAQLTPWSPLATTARPGCWSASRTCCSVSDPNTRPGRLVERRDADIDEGLLRLQEVATDEAGLPLDTLCEVLLSARAERPDDDIAVLALRAR